MGIRNSLQRILDNYHEAFRMPLRGNDLAEFIRHEGTKPLRETVGAPGRYMVEGSHGKGNWSKVPWIGIFDRSITTSARNGYYVAYLFCEDMSGVFLSLTQAVREVRLQYGTDTKKALRARASDYVARLGGSVDDERVGSIDLHPSAPTDLGAFYGASSICSRYYARGELPDDATLANDLLRYLDLYLELQKLLSVSEPAEPNDDDTAQDKEGATQLRVHRSIERKPWLAKKAKKIHGYQCMACGFDFESIYGDLGEKYIEAHHLTPLSELKGREATFDAETDFAVLCSNCHRMIHRSDYVSDVVAFRQAHLATR